MGLGLGLWRPELVAALCGGLPPAFGAFKGNLLDESRGRFRPISGNPVTSDASGFLLGISLPASLAYPFQLPGAD